jgi:hypothetical protein
MANQKTIASNDTLIMMDKDVSNLRRGSATNSAQVTIKQRLANDNAVTPSFSNLFIS